ncbi:maltokinase N-terminal cap-like domain-containing protein [Streptomyces sp. KLOTTS4A1]|uniref:maltokinase N-terminal cap-like domain-containing protein n=1 Tax=Streptomyces sp. KLOTTS4A1 TaxID=3390996 RepID=UPI0039F5197C
MAKTETARAAEGVLRPGLLTELLRSWLPRQRWFARGEQPIADVSLLSVTELYPGCLHLLVRVEHGAANRHGHGHERWSGRALAADCYQLLIGLDRYLPSHLTGALVGRTPSGLAVYDALQDPRTAALLLERLRQPGHAGPLRFTNDAATLLPAGLPARLLEAEQSNTSIVYGDAFILKVFRRIQPGINPDLEVPWVLARAGCPRVPAPVAWIRTTRPQHATLAVLQPYLPEAADGWTLALHALDGGWDFTAEARHVGQATADVHRALAKAFPTPPPLRSTRTATPAGPADGSTDDASRTAAAMCARLDAATHCLPALRPYAPALRTTFDALAARGGRGTAPLPHRIHGDLHLGQVLRTGRDWYLIDFEGEPSAPLAERRGARSPVRDVAGMLRSFDYASGAHRPGRPGWAEACRDAYCTGYADHAGWDPRSEPELLRAYETDRAVYEAVYEARHRPDWLHVPMAAIRRLAAVPEREGTRHA